MDGSNFIDELKNNDLNASCYSNTLIRFVQVSYLTAYSSVQRTRNN